MRWLCALLLVLVTTGTADAQEPPLPTLPDSAEIEMKLQRDGSLSVAEAVSVSEPATRTIPLRVPSARNRERVYSIRDLAIEGAGTAEQTGDAVRVTVRGTTTIRYTVDGVVRNVGDHLEVSWQLTGWNAALTLVRASFAAPRIAVGVRCDACTAAQNDQTGLTRFSAQRLDTGGRLHIAVDLPPGTVAANARLEPARTLAGAFVFTAPVAAGWFAFGLLLLAGMAALWRTRREGEPLPSGFTAEPFATPDGVLPGHIALLRNEDAEAVTAVDLAVRGYLGPAGERLHDADDQLTGFERRVLDGEAPGDAVERDAIRRGWLRSPGRARRAGIRIVCYGLFLTIVLALTVGYAQLGVVLTLAGAALALGARFLPSTTRRGRTLLRRLADPAELPATERFAPYALALGRPVPATAFALGEFLVALRDRRRTRTG
ncbi:DUF2207 domain-containing protein [Amycolatopsis endophytica]|uniref:DUF2207 domain-containing protein n=1 Tax=Amycolatopsis endophytica TaxID=860233 RepID=A0A853AXJ8_9PSEU|nr:DUF2207 domain-containing protein [Amycolatopsis endophytica]NYI87410.1 hypothetical protein [Amycolatopsis endophytica]